MKFSEFRQYQPKSNPNVVGFVCDDDFLVAESRGIWQRIFGGNWFFEKCSAREFEEMPKARLKDDALTPSLFSRNRALIVTAADKLTKASLEALSDLQNVPDSSLKIVLVTANRKLPAAWGKMFPAIEIDPLKPSDAARWIMDRHRLAPEVARYLVDSVGTDLSQIHNEIEKLQTYTAGRPIEAGDVDALVLRSERFGRFDLDDAILAADYRRAVLVAGAMLEEGEEPLIVLSRITRLWRQLLTGKALAGKKSAKDVASAAGVPSWKAGEFAAACRKLDSNRLADGFLELLRADRAFKTSTPNPSGYFDVMLWKLIGNSGGKRGQAG